MLAFARAGIFAALVILLSVIIAAPAAAAEKAFQRDDLADAAIKLEAQIKSDAGAVTKSGRTTAARRRRRIPAQRFPQRHAAARPDRGGGARGQRQLAAARQVGAADSLRPTIASAPRCSNAHRLRPISPISAHRARPKKPTLSASSRAAMPTASSGGRRSTRMRLSLELREVADVRQQYERMREDHGFRLLDYSVDADAASPRACFQFSEELSGQAHRLLAVRRGRRARTSPRCRSTRSSSASKASSTASATTSRCAPAFLRS